jgi:type I restriction enzyme S subunit
MRGKPMITEKRLGDITSVITKGTTPTTLGRQFTSSGIPFLKVESISEDGMLVNDKVAWIDEETHQLLRRSQIQPGDILFSIAGAIGRTLLIESPFGPANTNQALAIVRPLDEFVSRKYLYYYLRSSVFQVYALGRVVQTAQANVSLGILSAAPVRLPPRSTQDRVASILSAYDELIENNTRRIAILEEMAQAIYREWFVNFRFPGHEQVEMVEQGPVPAGWEMRVLGDLAEEIRRSVAPEELDPDMPYVGLEHLPRRSIALAEWGRAADVQSTKLSFRKGEILFGKIRPYFHKVGVAPLDGICSSDTIVIVPKVEHYSGLVLACVSSDAFVAHATQTSQGTKMPRANWNVLVDYPVVTPPSDLLRQFNRVMDSVVLQIHNLIFRNRNLREARDLLLPRLISGEIEVAAMEDELAGAAA